MNTLTDLIELDDKILIKMELNNISGSHKYRAANYIIENAISEGLIDANTTVIEKTGGNFGFGLLAACLKRNIPVELAIGLSFSKEKKEKLKKLGAHLIGEEMLSNGKTPKEVVEWHLANQGLLKKEYFYTDQFNNIGSYLAHLETGNEIVGQIEKCNSKLEEIVLVGCAGTGASFAGVSDALENNGYKVTRVLVEPKGCDSKNNVFTEHPMEGMSVGVKAPFINWEKIDQYYYAEIEKLDYSKKEIYSKLGLLVGNTSAACYQAVKFYQNECTNKRKILTFFYDSGIWYK